MTGIKRFWTPSGEADDSKLETVTTLLSAEIVGTLSGKDTTSGSKFFEIFPWCNNGEFSLSIAKAEPVGRASSMGRESMSNEFWLISIPSQDWLVESGSSLDDNKLTASLTAFVIKIFVNKNCL